MYYPELRVIQFSKLRCRKRLNDARENPESTGKIVGEI